MRARWEPVQKYSSRLGSVIWIILLTGIVYLYNWNNEAVDITHVLPSMERVNIYEWVRQGNLAKPQLHLIAEQTGVSEKIIEELLEQGYWQLVLELQEDYFAPVYTVSEKSSLVTVSEYLVDEEGAYVKGMPIVDVQDGDILITKNSRFLGWRNGHAGIVVDAQAGLVLEAIMLGTDTKMCRLAKWEEYPSFLVLRLREEIFNTKEVAEDGMAYRKFMQPAERLQHSGDVQQGTFLQLSRGLPSDKVLQQSGMLSEKEYQGTVDYAKAAAQYAINYLQDIPYHLLAGVGERLFPDGVPIVMAHATEEENGAVGVPAPQLKGTQCAHLVWYAYKQVGIDLDSDGGILVTPYDIQNSPYLEVVQSYGY